MARLSPRLQEVLDALPLRPGLRVLEVGCGPGALARAIAARSVASASPAALQRQASRSRNTSCARAASSLPSSPSASAVRTHSAASAFMPLSLKHMPRRKCTVASSIFSASDCM